MSLLEDLRFTKGAVAKRDYEPALQHFRIQDSKILGFNGAIALSSPIDLNLTCTPRAVPLVRAIEVCKDTVSMHMTAGGRLAIQSGPFRVFIECLPEDKGYPQIEPEGEMLPIDGKIILEAFNTLEPFIAEDASKPWARGILLRGQSAFATNNILLVEKWLGVNLPEVNVPEEAITELVRIGEPPETVQIGKGSITFHFASGRWLRSQLLSTEWPDVSRILDQELSTAPLPLGFFSALRDLLPFVGELGAVFLTEGKISTTREEYLGATVNLKDVPDLPEAGWNVKQLLKLEGVAQAVGLRFPEPSLFYGGNLRGVMVGLKI